MSRSFEDFLLFFYHVAPLVQPCTRILNYVTLCIMYAVSVDSCGASTQGSLHPRLMFLLRCAKHTILEPLLQNIYRYLLASQDVKSCSQICMPLFSKPSKI